MMKMEKHGAMEDETILQDPPTLPEIEAFHGVD
jgi:hypothetical protein